MVFTIVAALLAFGSLWYLQPGTPKYIIDEAKQRQSVPLLEVNSPAQRAPGSVIDYDSLAKKVTPQVKQALLLDSDFMAKIAASVTTLVEKDVETNLKPLWQADIKKSLTQKMSKSDFDTALPQLVDALLPDVVQGVYDEIEANKASYIKSLAEQVQLPEDQIVSMYTTYRNKIVKDLVPDILDELESDARMKLVPVPPKSIAITSKVMTQEQYELSQVKVETPTTTPEPEEIAIPKVSISAQSNDLTTEEYQAAREAQRSAAIDEVLSRISSGETTE